MKPENDLAPPDSSLPAKETGKDDVVTESKRGAPVRVATHASKLEEEIAITAPDGLKRVPFSVVLGKSGEMLVLSFLTDGGAILDRFAGGKHAGTVARLPGGDAPGSLRSPAGVAMDDDGSLFIPVAQRRQACRT